MSFLLSPKVTDRSPEAPISATAGLRGELWFRSPQRLHTPLPHTLQDKAPGSTKKILCIAETLKPVQRVKPPFTHSQRKILQWAEQFCSSGTWSCISSQALCLLDSLFQPVFSSEIPNAQILRAGPFHRGFSSRTKSLPKTSEDHHVHSLSLLLMTQQPLWGMKRSQVGLRSFWGS